MYAVPEWVLLRLRSSLRTRRGSTYTAKQLARAARTIIEDTRRQQETQAEYSGWKRVLDGAGGARGSLAAAHALMRGPPTFAAAASALRRALDADDGPPARDDPGEGYEDEDRGGSGDDEVTVSVLDYGAGCGSASLAAMEVLANASQEGRARPRFRVDCVEPSDALRGAGRAILPEAFWGKSLGSLRRAEYDVALCTFALGELGTRRERSGAVRRLWSRLRPGGVLLCLEAGTPSGSGLVTSVREDVLPSGEARVLAPCAHALACPMASREEEEEGVGGPRRAREWCHFAQAYAVGPRDEAFGAATHWASYGGARSPRLKASRPGGRGAFVEKFAYLALQKKRGAGDDDRGEGRSVLGHLLGNLGEGGEEGGGERVGRVVGTPRRRGRHVVFRVCDSRGRLDRHVLTKSHPAYAERKAAKWGDLLEIM